MVRVVGMVWVEGMVGVAGRGVGAGWGATVKAGKMQLQSHGQRRFCAQQGSADGCHGLGVVGAVGPMAVGLRLGGWVGGGGGGKELPQSVMFPVAAASAQLRGHPVTD